MIELQDKLRPTQPFFVLDTDRFYQEVFARQGISHFYTFRSKGNTNLRIVPDGCIDLIFGYAFETEENQHVEHCRKAFFIAMKSPKNFQKRLYKYFQIM